MAPPPWLKTGPEGVTLQTTEALMRKSFLYAAAAALLVTLAPAYAANPSQDQAGTWRSTRMTAA
jgi:hypothetical protein